MNYFESLKINIPVDHTICEKKNDVLELEGWKTLKRLANKSKLTEN